MTVGAGIAIAGIWLGVGLIGLRSDGEHVGWCAVCAALATLFVSMSTSM
jgi:hypothetical protein